MPLLLSKSIGNEAAYAVWNIQETVEVLQKQINEPFPENLHLIRLSEWMVGRILVRGLCSKFEIDYQGIEIDPMGKPFLSGSTAQISITHSFPMAAALIHMKKPCGIDLERPREKMLKVRDKFINGREIKHADDVNSLCAIWCGKEVLFKIYGRKKLSLKDDTQIEIIAPDKMIGKILMPGEESEYEIHYEPIKEYYLAYSL